ncbi:MAG: SGNH/GDSL hydrolase family protein [Acetatifactor sp.]
MEKKKFRLNLHIIFLISIVLFVIILIFALKNWGVFVDQNELFKDGEGTYVDNYDYLTPLKDSDYNVIPLKTSDGLNIMLLGNGPFAEDRNSGNGLANMIAETANATVYNCSISGSYVAWELPYLSSENPMDAFSPYWLSIMTTEIAHDDYYGNAVKVLGDNAPAEADEVRQTLESIDYDKLDAVVIMYDATDYFMGHPIYDTEDYAPVQQYIANLEATLDTLQENHPNVRIIVMSPTYAFSDQLDENGEYISSDIYTYGGEPLSRYAISAQQACAGKGVTYIDNIYGTFNEDQAKDYLTDNLHLNTEGRRKVAERLVSALLYFGTN